MDNKGLIDKNKFKHVQLIFTRAIPKGVTRCEIL